MTVTEAAGRAERLEERLRELASEVNDPVAARSLAWAADHARTARRRLMATVEPDALDGAPPAA